MTAADHKLRVLHIASGDLWAGAEVQVYTLLSQLREHCHLKVILLNDGRLCDECRALGLDVEVFDERTLNSIQILKGLYRAIRSFRPDIIHTHRQKENILGVLAGRLAGFKKSVRTSHGAPEFESNGLRRLRVKLDQWIGKHWQSRVIAVSDDLAEKLRACFPEDHVAVIHNGIDESKVKAQAGLSPFDSEGVHIGIAGRLEPVKRADIFLEMAARLLQENQNQPYHFHVIGDGSQRLVLEDQARDLSIKSSVQFHGHRDDIPSCLRGLDVLVMCSDHEGTPMVALEALALGTPLVAHNVGGLNELLSDYPQMLVDDHSPDGYAQVVRTLLSPSRETKVVLQACYTARENAESTLALYQRVMEEH